MDKMTDSEIVKTIPLEKQIEHYNERLKEVFEWYNRKNTEGCEDPLEICVLRDSARLIPKLVDLINHLQEENERLKTAQFQFISNANADKKMTAKSEAYKEFAERLKKGAFKINYCGSSYNVVDTDDVDNLLKEMVGDNDASK